MRDQTSAALTLTEWRWLECPVTLGFLEGNLKALEATDLFHDYPQKNGVGTAGVGKVSLDVGVASRGNRIFVRDNLHICTPERGKDG